MLALFCLALPGLTQDTIGDGFAQTASQPTPAAFASYATLSSGDRVVFDGLSIDLYDASGAYLMNLATLPGFVFNSFVEVDPSESFAIVGESSNGGLLRVALDGSGFTNLANLAYNFDAAFEDAGHILVSAATCGFNPPCGNDIFRVDVNTGASVQVVFIAGSSGPLAVSDDGALFYATVDTTLQNGTEILSWSSAQLSGGGLLGYSDATVHHAGLQTAYSMAIDPVFGNIFVAESVFAATSRILEIDVSSGALADVVVESSGFLSHVELIKGSSIGHFHAYQPDDGVFMHYNNGDIVSVRPQRPTATHQQVGPLATLQVQGGKPNGAMMVLFAPQGQFDPNYITYQLNFNFLFHSSVPVFQQHRTPLLIPLDAAGTGTFQYYDPGQLAGTLVFQSLITDATGNFIGSSEAALN